MTYSLAGTFSDGISRQQNIPHAVSHRRKLSGYIAAALVGTSIMMAQDVHAVGSKRSSKNKTPSEKAVNELQAENARLREQVEQLLAAQRTRDAGAAPALGVPSGVGTAVADAGATAAAEAVAKKEAAETDKSLCAHGQSLKSCMM